MKTIIILAIILGLFALGIFLISENSFDDTDKDTDWYDSYK